MYFRWLLLSAVFFITACQSERQPPEGMVKIPGGTFTMGGKTEQASRDEFPRHQVTVTSFFMDKYEVTNAQFREFVDATGYVTVAEKPVDWDEMAAQLPPGTPKPADSVLQPGSLIFQPTDKAVPLDNPVLWWKWTIGASWRHPFGPGSTIDTMMHYPVVHIAYDDAVAYAQWAGKRLPTEAEWEWASMGGLEDAVYPWGNTSVEEAYTKANFWQGSFPNMNYQLDGYQGAAPVGSFPPNGYGLYDMAGNVWEWCIDHYNAGFYGDQEGEGRNPVSRSSYDPNDPYTEKFVTRGGSFLCNDSYCSGYRVSRRMSSSRDSGFNHTGFRCVKDL